MRFPPNTLQGKFFTGLILLLLLLGGLFALALQRHTQELLLSEAREKARLMMAHTQAIQSYVRQVLRPSVSRIIEPNDFIIEAMSTSFVTRHILSNLHLESDAFQYRRIAKNARNPGYEVTAEEDVLFKRFTEDPTLVQLEQTVEKNGLKHLIISRPVYFSSECLRCHGLPQDAPAVLLAQYGSERGFHRRDKELAGMEIISVPLQSTTRAVTHSVTMFAVWFASGMVILLVGIQAYFNRLVVHNLRRVGTILQQCFFQDSEKTLLEPLQREEEIEGMIQSIEGIATHMAGARNQLNAYAKNLESMVSERTMDLETVLAERNADVDLFVRLLRSLMRHGNKQNLLCASLNLVARHFGASGALYACGFAGMELLVWPDCLTPPYPKNAGRFLPPGENLHDLSLQALESPVIGATYWLLPVQTSGQSRGVYGLFWETAHDMPEQSNLALAIAFGTQIGIALDNLESLDTLLRQNALLDSLVEGVPDPLILLGENGSVLLTNSSARRLADRLWDAAEKSENKKNALQEPHTGPHRRFAYLLQCMRIVPGLEGRRGQHGTYPVEIVLDGGETYSLGIYPFGGEKDSPGQTIIHIRETTDEKQLLNHLRRSEKLAAVGQLAASIAHEINNPLGVIRCYAELLGASLSTEQERADVEVILKHVENAQSVLRDLLQFSRPKATKADACDVRALLCSLGELFKPKLSSKRARLDLTVEPDLPLLHTDCGLLEQVLVNLLLNAIDALPGQDGLIRLTASCPAGQEHIRIVVADNGSGIDEADLATIFDPFFSTKSAGTGLGLTIAFGMIREMKGVLEVRNTCEHTSLTGAEFIITLPLHATEHTDDTP